MEKMKKLLAWAGRNRPAALAASFMTLYLLLQLPVLARITGTTTEPETCWGADGAEVCVDSSGRVVPTTDNDASLGTSTLRWSDVLTMDVTVSDDLTVSDDATITDALTVNGNTTLGDAGGDTLDLNGTTVTINATVTGMKIGTSTTDGTYLLTLDGSNRRLGLGTHVPATLLDVEGAYQFGSGANKSTGSASGGLTVNPAAQVLVSSGSATVPGLAFNGDANNGLYAPAADALSMVTGGSERTRLNSSGNFGIGTTNPGRPFSADGGGTNNYVSSMSVNGQTLQHYADTTGNFLFDGGGTLGNGGPLVYFDNVGANNGAKGIGFGFAGSASFTLDGNGAITQMPRISSSTIVLDGNVSPAINIKNGGLQVWSRTKAQVDALVPEAVGQIIFCSDCSTANICVSTGTAAAQWLRVDSTTVGCGSNN